MSMDAPSLPSSFSSSKQEQLFEGLPPPSSSSHSAPPQHHHIPPQFQPPKPAIKRPPPPKDDLDDGSKHVRFKTTVEASTDQVISAMKKITAHIGNPAKFSKASKLALQLLQAGSVKKDTIDSYYEILRTAMASPSLATEASLRGDYHELFFAVNEHLDCFNSGQQAQLEVWFLWALVANDLFTDDTFVFSRAAAKVRQVISSLPGATEAEDASEEASATPKVGSPDDKPLHQAVNALGNSHITGDQESEDPFGLNDILPTFSKKERAKKKKEEEAAIRRAQEDIDRLLREQREALIMCLNIAASRYKLQWAQTIIDILVKHAFDNISRFTAQQRNAIEKLWISIKEQYVRRKQGKATSGKLDVTPFEQLQQKYAKEKISIRHAVGASGDRTAEQWLG